MQNIALIILTYNAKRTLGDLLDSVFKQALQPDSVLVIDSGSYDGTLDIIKKYNVILHAINKADFDHGATRRLATQLINADIYVYMTQDAILADRNSLSNLIRCFGRPEIGCAYGRQLPNQNANVLAVHSRLFNYPPANAVKKYSDRSELGIKTCFVSNSFAAYRAQALNEAGGFPVKIIMGEDMYIAAKMLLQNWEISYCANALVLHSHNYTIWQEFKRYFDIGVFHQTNLWILNNFQTPNKEGLRYVKSEMNYCIRNHVYGMLLKSAGITCAKIDSL